MRPATAEEALDNVCEAWAAVAAAEAGVPERLMRAITEVETARGPDGAWPWALNIEGQGRWFASRAEAIDYASRAISAGADQVDIGCFQLNLKWHGAAFRSLDQMIDPARNARYAARFLTHLHAEFGNWTEAAAAFHSRTPHLGHAYLERLQVALAVPDTEAPGNAGREATVLRAPRPLLAPVAPLGGTLPSAGGAMLPADGTDGRGGLLFVRR